MIVRKDSKGFELCLTVWVTPLAGGSKAMFSNVDPVGSSTPSDIPDKKALSDLIFSRYLGSAGYYIMLYYLWVAVLLVMWWLL